MNVTFVHKAFFKFHRDFEEFVMKISFSLLYPPPVKIILAINLVFTILISVLLLIGVIKRHKFLMLPWVILAIILAVGLAFSVIYTAVVFIIAGEVFGGMFWIVGGLITVGKYGHIPPPYY